jgi:hypothetical protein
MPSSSFDGSWTLSYRRRYPRFETEATVNEAILRQRNLLNEGPDKPLPKDVEAKVFELLVQLLLAVAPAAAKGEERNE